jgi:hypothetical protein
VYWASPWAAFVLLGFGAAPTIPFEALFAIALAWAAFTFFLMCRWTSSFGWNNSHRFALVAGGVLACMIGSAKPC